MRKISLIAMALAMLLVAGCSSQQMAQLQHKCNGGDQSACKELAAPNPGLTVPLPG
jgi:hypothetical protein